MSFLNGGRMAKTSNSKPNSGAFALEFIGSLIYFAMIYFTSSGSAASGVFATAITSVWLPLLYAAGLLSAVALFVLSFTNMMKHNPIARAAMAPACIGGFAFIAMTAGNFGLVILALIGFLFASSGAVYAKLSSE
jgi:hypothetical protein